MRSNIITVIPVYNGEKFILPTLESIARQSLRPDRVIVLDNCSTDGTEKIVREFTGLACEWIRNPQNLGLFGNFNRALEFATETRYLHLCCADDLVQPGFLAKLTVELDDCDGFGLGWCLDERIDEDGHHLSVSGKANGAVDVIPVDTFLCRKAEISNQAISGSLLKTNYQPAPAIFRLDMPILADVAFWAAWGKHCRKLVQVNSPLSQYRWHGDNATNQLLPGIQALILDEWKVMQLNEQLRAGSPSPVRRFKLKGLFAVRTGVKAKRVRQQNNLAYAAEITREGKKISGPLAWWMGQAVVEARDWVIYGLLRRRRHPRNIYS
jgi:glycosyltransferase involved in cell wall biosynthesis